jgi:hypothetical protein
MTYSAGASLPSGLKSVFSPFTYFPADEDQLVRFNPVPRTLNRLTWA